MMAQDTLAERIDFALHDVLPAHPLGGEIESTNAGEEGGVTHEVAYGDMLHAPAMHSYCFRHTLWHHAPMTETKVRSVRIPDDEREAALSKGKSYGLREFSAIVRFALQRLPLPREKK